MYGVVNAVCVCVPLCPYYTLLCYTGNEGENHSIPDNSSLTFSACKEWYAMRISSVCSTVRARGLLQFNTAIIVSKELNCKELGFSLEVHEVIFRYCN